MPCGVYQGVEELSFERPPPHYLPAMQLFLQLPLPSLGLYELVDNLAKSAAVDASAIHVVNFLLGCCFSKLFLE
jgi:hypothetical protein